MSTIPWFLLFLYFSMLPIILLFGFLLTVLVELPFANCLKLALSHPNPKTNHRLNQPSLSSSLITNFEEQ